jgi:hypothetical protein
MLKINLNQGTKAGKSKRCVSDWGKSYYCVMENRFIEIEDSKKSKVTIKLSSICCVKSNSGTGGKLRLIILDCGFEIYTELEYNNIINLLNSGQ